MDQRPIHERGRGRERLKSDITVKSCSFDFQNRNRIEYTSYASFLLPFLAIQAEPDWEGLYRVTCISTD